MVQILLNFVFCSACLLGIIQNRAKSAPIKGDNPGCNTFSNPSFFDGEGCVSIRECLSTGAVGSRTRRSLGHHFLHTQILRPNDYWHPQSRALPDITSGPEVRQIFKIRTVRKPDVFLPEAGLARHLKIEKKKNQNQKLFFSIFFSKCF